MSNEVLTNAGTLGCAPYLRLEICAGIHLGLRPRTEI